MDAFVILNASAGWQEQETAPETVRRVFDFHGIACNVTVAAAGSDIGELAAGAVREGARLVVAGGGDGTLRAVASALAGTGVTMGVLPAGTLNHFARDLEIPLDVAAAAETAAAGIPLEVDVAEVNRRVFINNASLGIFPTYRFERVRRERRGRGRLPAFLGAVWSAFRRYPFLQVALEVNGRRVVHRTPYLVIGNNEHAMEGFRPWERERMNEGLLWIYIARDRTRRGLLRVALKVLTGRLRAEDEFEVLHAPEVRVETPRRRIGVSLDGEVFPLETPLEFRSRPRALRVMAPAGSRFFVEPEPQRQ